MIRWDKKLEAMSREKREYALAALIDNVLASKRWDRLAGLLLNIFFLESKTEAGRAVALADDFGKAKAAVPLEQDDHRFYILLEEAIRRDIHFIQSHPCSLFQCLWNTCWWYDCPKAGEYYDIPSATDDSLPPWRKEGPKLFGLMERFREAKKKSRKESPWMRSLAPPHKPLGGGLRSSYSGHTEAVCHLCFSRDGKYLLSASYDSTVRLWDSVTLQEKASVTIENGSFLSAGFLKSGKPVYATILEDGHIKVSLLKTQMELVTLAAPDRGLECHTVSSDWDYVACGYQDGTVLIWSISNGEMVVTFDVEDFAECSCETSSETRLLPNSDVKYDQSRDSNKIEPNSTTTRKSGYLLGRLADFLMHILNLRRRLTSRSMRHPNRMCARAMSFTGDGKRLAWVSDFGIVHIYDMDKRAERSANEVQEFASEIVISGDGQKVFCGGLGGVAAFDVNTGKFLWYPEKDSTDSVTGMQLSKDEKTIACGRHDGRVSIVDAGSGRTRCEYRDNAAMNTYTAISPDSKWIALAQDSERINILRLHEMQSEAIIPKGHTGKITCLSVYPDGSRFITGSMDGSIRIWESDTAQELAVLKGNDNHISALCLAKEGELIVSLSDDRTIQLWKTREAQELCDPMRHKSIVQCLAVSGESSRIVSGDIDGMIHVWDMESGRPIRSFQGHKFAVEHLDLSYDGRILASGGYDFALRIWNMPSCSVEAVVEDKDDGCLGAPMPRFIGRSTRLVCWFGDDKIRILDLQDGHEEACFEANQPIRYFTLTDNGEFAIIECENHEIMVWNTTTHDLVRRFTGYVVTEGDIWAISQDSSCWPWRAVPSSGVTCIENIRAPDKTIWINRRILSVLPQRPIWIGTEGAFLYSYMLEDPM